MKFSKTCAGALLTLVCTGYLALAETPLDHWLIKQASSETSIISSGQAPIGTAPGKPADNTLIPLTPVAAAQLDPKMALENALAAMIEANRPDSTIREEDGRVTVTNVTSMLVLVNKERHLPADYIPSDLVIPNVPFSFAGDHPKKQLRKPAAKALERLFHQAKAEGVELKAVSGYRSYATQEAIFKRNAELKGEEEANRTSAYPGQSEHQSGLAMDVSAASVNYDLVKKFGQTTEGKWLKEHAHEFGFIIRYVEGREGETGYDYEPWHLRFVGVDAAKRIVGKGFILETFLKA